ncbi:MAG: glycoside hydrolase family 3 C-terminal domain-containing protein [Sphingobium sp.]|nr:glycoside hydrolase family 3 C-terminal domain-containing protein [Sphingobium sp.]
MEGKTFAGPLVATLSLLAAAPLRAQSSGQATIWATQGAHCQATTGEEKAWANKSYAAECRARFALREFRSMEEKLAYLDPQPGGQARDVAKVLGLPVVGGSDGPAGLVREDARATALPSPIAIAATFDRAAAARYGDIIGQEWRAAGLGNILGPAFDIARSWKAGRLPESFGEDPFLTAEMAASEIPAIQANGVIVTMKHFVAYAQEAGRVGGIPSGTSLAGNNMLSEKALREIYLPGFEAAVRRGHAGGVMCAFPRINGTYACENPHLFDILKREWGFDGTVGPDFPSGQRSIARAVIAGLDTGSFRASSFNAGLAHEKPLRQAVADGDIPEARIDDLILRRLVPMFRVGLYDNPPVKGEGPASTPEHRAAAAQLLAEGTVLLRNQGRVLPFTARVRSIAVIGPQATADAVVVEQGSPYVKPAHLEPALDAIKARAGKAVRVTFAPGTRGLGPLPLPAAGLFRTPDGRPGFRADYVANTRMDFSGALLASATVAQVDLAKVPDIAGLPADNGWSVRYSARLKPAVGGVHKFSLHGSGSARLFIDGVERGSFELADFASQAFANVALTAGKPVHIRIDYSPRSALRPQRMSMFGLDMGLTLRFGYAPPDSLIADAVKAARQADVAIVFAGQREGEGMDRTSLALQNDQDALIEAVAAANPRTVVVLSTGAPVAMPWAGKVAAVLETWKPGDAFGPAVAQMLFGDREPGGRLPVTFPIDESQGPATLARQFPGTRDPQTGAIDTAYFDEGVFVGYRFYDQYDQVPLFPFGQGLGYGDISFASVAVKPTNDGGATVTVTVRLENKGTRPASEVAQLYVGFPDEADEPPRQLKGFAKAMLQPGESRELTITLPRETFRHWDELASRWRIAGGVYQLYVGRSSRDIVWQGELPVAGD